jgi:sugar phosphate isomerase/epimerase
VLKLLHDVGEPGIGITFNIGHASLDGCLPAASLAHVLASGAPLYIHICDAAGQWDWDVLPGSHHYWQLLECLQLLRDNGYDGWLTSDSFPIRQEPLEFAAMHIQRTARALLTVESAARSEDGMRSWRELEAWVVQNR